MKEFIVYNLNIDKKELKNLNIFISDNSVVQDGATIFFNTCITGDSIIYSTAVIHNNSTISDSIIRSNCNIYASRIENCEVGENSKIGPFANLKNVDMSQGSCKVGNFVVLKNSVLSNNVVVNHLSNVNNAEIGANSEICSGVVFSADGENKILIGDNVKIGANSSLIAPVSISDESYVAIGSVIDKDIETNQYAIARAKQQNSEFNIKKAK